MTIVIPGLYENAGRKELRPISVSYLRRYLELYISQEKDSILERYKTRELDNYPLTEVNLI